MEDVKPKSIFDSHRSVGPHTRKSSPPDEEMGRHNRLKTPLDVNAFIENNEGRFEVHNPQPRDPWIGLHLDPATIDDFDFEDKNYYDVIGNGINSHLMQMIPLDDITSGTYDDLELGMDNLTDDGGVKKSIILEGNGIKVPNNAFVSVHVIGFAEGNDDPIDSSSSQRKMTIVNLGNGEAILGLLIGLQSMEVGEIAKFLLCPEYAYGKLGCPGLISQNCRLLYVVEMVEFSFEPEKKKIWRMTNAERSKLDFEEIFKSAKYLRELGNRKFKLCKFLDALDRYEAAQDILKEAEVTVTQKQEDVERNALRYILYSNMALCHLRLNQASSAAYSCERALDWDMPTPSAKIYYRYAKAMFKLNKLTDAAELCEKALKLDNHWDIQMFRKEIRVKLDAE